MFVKSPLFRLPWPGRRPAIYWSWGTASVPLTTWKRSAAGSSVCASACSNKAAPRRIQRQRSRPDHGRRAGHSGRAPRPAQARHRGHRARRQRWTPRPAARRGRTNLSRIIETTRARRQGALDPHRNSAQLRACVHRGLRNIYRDLADRYGVRKSPFILEGIADKPENMHEDGIHPKPEAQEAMLENVWPSLLPLL